MIPVFKQMLRAFICVLALVFFVTPMWADDDRDDYKKFSRNHAPAGVSQLIVGNISQLNVPLKLINPNRKPHAVAVLVYGSDRGFNPTGSGVYRSCLVEVLPPHGSVGISKDELPGGASYVEIISAPVNGKKRLADGLGIVAHGTDGHPFFLLNPSLFSLPSDEFQRQEAIDCVLNGLSDLSVGHKVFKGLGIPKSHRDRNHHEKDDDNN